MVRDEAIAMARRVGDRQGLALVLSRSYWLRGPTPFRDILDMLAEGRDIAQQLGDIEIGAEAFQWRIASLIAIGDLERRPGRAGRAARHGRADAPAVRAARGRAVRRGDRAVRRASARGGGRGRAVAGVEPPAQPAAIRRASTASRCSGSAASRAGSPSWRPAVRRARRPSDSSAAWRPGLAALMAELGMVQEARAELDRVRADGLDTLRPALWLASLTYLADVCSIVGDAEMARLVYAELLPHSGSSVMIGHAVACYGAADRYLGMLAATFGDRERAAAPLRGGARARPRGGRAHVGRAHGVRVRPAASRRRERDDAGRATELLAEAAELAKRIGMRALLERIHAARRAGRRRPRGSPRGRSRSCVSWPAGSRTATSAGRSRSASTPPPTTSAASCERPAPRIAPRRRPTHTPTG